MIQWHCKEDKKGIDILFNTKNMLELCDIYTALKDEYYSTTTPECEADKILDRLLAIEDELIKELVVIGIDEKTAKLMVISDMDSIKNILKRGV